ncbi:ATP synthase F0 subcomplex B subunit [Acetitomaculum ruminis DSM 5522]|uniref:ATP synthase subunit b n=1 Tax=Acetitomaculum ruminis DSM 5522 TaxID=1120918 RepID=A0A1I0YR85_9FIRM|nr:F0F1 ATP synthase subunit B [Acetitomaculum ruminis]SFB15885.1 ATP synthase F0 subcomplex B subunit [Acetitomaculum ruminis DSM 5522]
MERLFNLDAQLLADSVLLCISVLILTMFLSYLLFNPVRKVLEDRKKRIASDINDAKESKKNAEQLKLEYEEKLKAVDKESEAILSEARAKALKNQEKIVADAKKEAASIIARANEEAELERKRAADEIKQEMVKIAAAMAQKVISASIDTTIQDSLVDETLKEMGDETWLS